MLVWGGELKSLISLSLMMIMLSYFGMCVKASHRVGLLFQHVGLGCL